MQFTAQKSPARAAGRKRPHTSGGRLRQDFDLAGRVTLEVVETLAVGIEKNFGVATPNAEVAREAFVSVNTIAAYITAKKRA